MQTDLLLEQLKTSKKALMDRFDFSQLHFYMFLPTFDSNFRKDLCKRISEFEGQVSLTPKAGIHFAIVSDNVISMILEKLHKQENSENDSYNQNTRERLNYPASVAQMLLSQKEVSNKALFKSFLQQQKENVRNEKTDMLDKIISIIKNRIPLLKITDLHYVLDYYDSFTKFEWHSKKDDCRLLRAAFNGEGSFIVTSRK